MLQGPDGDNKVKEQNKVQNKVRNLIAGGLITAGILLMAYPFISNYLYEHRQEEIIYGYQSVVKSEDNEMLKQEYQKAVDYNKHLYDSEVKLTDPFLPGVVKDVKKEEYYDLLNIYGDGMMGYIEISAISVFLPIYHGTTSEVLDKGVGHLENTSLPVGGKGTHAVLSAHTGLSDKKLFTDLELLKKGDIFHIQILDEILAYQVDDIRVVEPEDISNLYVSSSQDYVTLVTCTPYGINSHRLLVRGVRIPYEEEQDEETQMKTEKEPSPWMRQYVKAVLAGLSLLFLLLFLSWIHRRRQR